MSRITIDVSDELFRDLRKRAKDNFLSVKEMVEDIVRRSMISFTERSRKTIISFDDKLISAFSREKRGRPRKRRK